MSAVQITDNTARKRFEIDLDGQVAFMEYIRTTSKIFLTHTEVPEAFTGQGIGKALVTQVIEQVESEGLKIVPLCPFVASYLRRHPEKQHLIAEGYSV